MPRVSRVTVSGLSEASKHLTKFLRTVETVPTQILLEEAPRIEETAKIRTPEKTGKLKESVKVRVSRDKRIPGLYAQASAINRGYDYALIQHENLSYNHPNGGQAKFLESAFVEGVERIERRIEQEVRYDK